MRRTRCIRSTPLAKSGPLAIREFREFIVNSQRTIDEWQKRIDERIRNVALGMVPFRGLHSDVQSLADRIAELEAKLAPLVAEEEQRDREPTDA